jgi:hypothetical protein
MKVEFTNRAVGDLRKISAQSRKEFGASVAAALSCASATLSSKSAMRRKALLASSNGPACACFRSFVIRSKYSTELSATRSESCTSDTRRGGRGLRMGNSKRRVG